MRKEWWGVIALTTLALSEFAYSRPQRAKMGKLRGWTCEEPECGKKYSLGWMLEFHHKIPVSSGGQDTEENAELLCLPHHADRHDDLGEPDVANSIRQRARANKGGRTWEWQKKHK